MEWTSVVAWLLALASLGWNILQWRWARKRPLLTYQVMSDEPLVPTIGDSRWGSIQVIRDQTSLKYPRSVMVEFANRGNVPATATQVEAPPEVSLVGKGIIIDATAQTIEGENGQVRRSIKCSQDDQRTWIEPRLINEKDIILFHLLVDGQDCEVRPYVKAEGFKTSEQKQYEKVRARTMERIDWIRRGLLSVLLVFAIYATFAAPSRSASVVGNAWDNIRIGTWQILDFFQSLLG